MTRHAPPSAGELLDLARDRFGQLTAAEEKLFTATAKGQPAVYGKGDPADAKDWPHDRAIPADRLQWLCTDRGASQHIFPYAGVDIQGLRIDGKLKLNGAALGFPLSITCSSVPDGIEFYSARTRSLIFEGTHSGSISADEVTVDGSIFLRNGFKAEGEVRLLGATIGGVLDCSRAHFANKCGRALSADGVQVAFGVFLRNNFRAEGEVRLLGASIGGNLECDNSQFVNEGGYALDACGINVNGSVYLRNDFKAEGEVRLLGATIDSNLDCTNGHFANKRGVALHINGIKVSGSVYLRNGFHAHGHVNCIGASVNGFFEWFKVKFPEDARLSLQSARVGTLRDDEESWPNALELDGFVYDRIHTDSPIDAPARIEWLRRQGDDHYLPQPYEQLAKALRAAGHEKDAKRILIAKQKDPARLRDMSRLDRVRHKVLGIIEYGYNPLKALRYMLPIILYGWIWFSVAGYCGDFAVTTRIDPAPPFDSFIYSLDTFIPIVDLHQQRFRSPAATGLRYYFYCHVAAGWILTSLFVAGLTGLVRK